MHIDGYAERAHRHLGFLTGLLEEGFEDFENVMELFRNESPLSLLFSGSGGGFENGILTAQDVVGVGEKEAATAGAVVQSAS